MSQGNVNQLWLSPRHLFIFFFFFFSIFLVISLLILSRGGTVDVSFPHKKGWGSTLQGYLDIACSSPAHMKANLQLQTGLHPRVEGSRGMQSPPSSQSRMGLSLQLLHLTSHLHLPGQHISQGLHRWECPWPSLITVTPSRQEDGFRAQ